MRLTKRLVALLLTAVLLITSVPAEFIKPMTAYADEKTTLTVTGDVVNVRSGAGTSYSKVTTVNRSTVLTSLGTAKDSSGTVWHKVSVNGSTGYIISTYVSASTTSSSTSKLTVTGTTVYVRKGAGTSYSYITTVKKGATYNVLGSAKDSSGKTWYKISINNTTGYIISTYVKVTDTAATTSTSTTKANATTTAAATRKLTVTGDVVNVRKGAGTSYSKVTAVKRNASYTVLDSAKDSAGTVWYKISVNGTTGYIISTYVKVTEVAVTTTTTTTTTKSTTALQVTTAASSSATGAASESAGTTTTTAASAVTSTTTTTTTKTTAAVATGTTLAANVNVAVSRDNVEMRSGAGSLYSLMTTLRKGEQVVILSNRTDSEGNLWYRVFYASVSGYIRASDLESTPTATTTTTTAAATTSSYNDGINVVTTTTTTKASATSGTISGVQMVTTSTDPISESVTTNNAVDTRTVMYGTVSCDSTLNVRQSASTGAKILGEVKNGSQVIIVDAVAGWYKIEYGSGYGFVSADYITDVKTGIITVKLSFAKDYYYVNQGSTVDMGINLSGYTVSYSSENSSAAPVSSSGVVTGNTPGLYTITATVGSATAIAEVVVLKTAYSGIQPMSISAEGAQFIAEWEGGGTPFGETVVFYPYQDSAGYWTVGYGHAITTAESKNWSREKAIEQFNIDIAARLGEGHEMTEQKPYLTFEEASALLSADLNDGPYVAAVSDWAVRNGVKLTQQQFDALVSFCFNLGPAYWTSDTYYFYLKSSIIAYRSGSDAVPEQVIEGFTRYIKAGGVNLKGLWWRRRNEAEMFLTGDYAIDRDNKFTLPNIKWG